MEPNNIENQIREKLSSREIQPTEMAWDRLDAMLSVSEEKKTKRFPFLTSKFIGIAASVLVFLSVGLYFINQENTVIEVEKSVVVKEQIKTNTSEENNKKIEEISSIPVQSQEQVTIIKNQQSKINNLQSSKSFNSINQKTNQNFISNKIEQIDYQPTEVIAQNDFQKNSSNEKIKLNQKIVVNANELLASIESPLKSPISQKVKINANSLLAEVDGELEQTFRQKVFQRITKNYKEIKVAIATRNQE